MPALASDLRRQLENVCIRARELAEAAARSVLMSRAVNEREAFAHFTPAQQAQRNRLRARGRQLGDVLLRDRTQTIDRLTQEFAYEYWHRMLFARFLAENHLLMHPDGVAVSLDECNELAPSEKAPNGFVLAARYASRMLPEIFRKDDVLLEIEFSPERRVALEKRLAELPRETFLADDSLGWVYQFWQTKRKEEVNRSGEKIDAETLPVVTQLFTEDYIVQFLLHNTIGAWAVGQAFQPDARNVRLESLTYLRRRDDGAPAAGTFAGWPRTLREFTLLDPCCGSGHFLVSAFHLLVPLRMRAEGLSARAAADAVLRDNLFGLEVDRRCIQIAAFALALAAWKYPDEHGEPLGFRPLPPLQLACTGIAPQASAEQWLRLAEESMRAASTPGRTSHRLAVLGREPIRNGLGRLHTLFSEAPFAGSLIDPNRLPTDLLTADYETLKPFLEAALTAEKTDDDARERAVAAAGMVKAAELLAREYTLVATNVPYLGWRKQHETLTTYCANNYPEAKADLATCFVERCLAFCAPGGTAALVAPHNWLFLGTYKKLRYRLLRTAQWNFVARLGEHAFESSQAAGAFVALLVLTQTTPTPEHTFASLDALKETTTAEKAAALRRNVLSEVGQEAQFKNPDARIATEEATTTLSLEAYAVAPQGIKTGDDDRWLRCFWEVRPAPNEWEACQSTVDETGYYGGLHGAIDWRTQGKGMVRPRIKNAAKGRIGVAICQMRQLPVSIYLGNHFDSNVAAVVPNDPNHLPAFFTYVSSSHYQEAVRRIDQTLKVTNQTLLKVPFDLAHWQKIAAEKYPNGLPKPHSDDPTQWLFNGHPAGSEDPLQVAVARLLGYRWPRQTGSSFPDCPALEPDSLEPFAAKEGLVCLPAVRGEPPAAERLLELLQKAFAPRMKHGSRQGCVF